MSDFRIIDENEDRIVVGFYFSEIGKDSPPAIDHNNRIYTRGEIQPVPIQLANTFCSIRKYDFIC